MPKPPIKRKQNKKIMNPWRAGRIFPLPKPHTLHIDQTVEVSVGEKWRVVGAPDSFSNLLQQQWTQRGFDWTEVGLKDKGRLNAQPRRAWEVGKRNSQAGLCWNSPAKRQQIEWLANIDMTGNEQWHAFGFLGICIRHHVTSAPHVKSCQSEWRTCTRTKDQSEVKKLEAV